MAERRERTAFRRSVAARVLVSYAIVTLAFALAAGFSLLTQRAAAREMRLVQEGYLPMRLLVHDLVGAQDTWNTQLNDITEAKNPADRRVWFDVELRGRPRAFDEVRKAIAAAFMEDRDEESALVGASFVTTTKEIERFAMADAERLDRLFHALDRNDTAAARTLRDELVTRGTQVRKRLGGLEVSVEKQVKNQLSAAQEREILAIRLLAVLSAITVLVGVLMALYARRVLRPLGRVTERAQAVARGDLEARPAVQSDDEIGELAVTFERMVAAIAEANTQLVAAERLATVGKMAAHVTHEIRNPLSSIALNLELLDEQLGVLRAQRTGQATAVRGDADAEAQALLRAIGKEVERLSGLSQQYLAFARQRPLDLEAEDVGAIVREGAEFARRELEQHGVELELDIAPDLPTVLADEGQLRQALLNLIRNAREAMPKGGRITVRVQGAANAGVLLIVEDEGPGIEPGLREHLFEPFFTTKSHGTGLGLAITLQIAKAHGGSIECESRAEVPGRPGANGTRFTLWLPGAKASTPPARSSPENAAE